MYKKNLVMLATVVMMAAFVSACGNGKQEIFESENHEKAWLLRVAANLSKNRIRYKPGPVFVYSKKGIIYSAGTKWITAISGLLNRRNGSG